MAVRSRLLLPDIAVRVASGEMEVVSRQALVEAVMEAVVTQDMAGGFISVAVQRQPTGAPNEMVTVSAMVEWKDRTDAKAQPEARAVPMPAIDEQRLLDHVAEQMGVPPEVMDEVGSDSSTSDEVAEAIEDGADIRVDGGSVMPFKHDDGDNPDGLDESLLQDEDVEAPESVR
jgi:hypothetical protein